MTLPYTLLLSHGGTTTDITGLTQKITWKGRKGSSSRSLAVSLIDDDGDKHARAKIKVEEGYQVFFQYNDSECFRGVVMQTKQAQDKIMSFTAYDNGVYLANNKDTFCYTNKTATDIFKDVCTRFGFSMGEVAQCTYTIPELTKSKTTAWDVIADALSLDFDATGIRHFVTSSGGKLNLTIRRDNILQWVIETGKNLTSYSYTRSIEDIVTRVKLLSDEGTVLAEAKNEALEASIGIFQDVDTPDETLTSAQIKELCESMLAESSTVSRSLSLQALGQIDVTAGVGVYVIIPHLELSRTFYVDEDSHTFEGNRHTMSLKLTYATDVAAPAEEDSPNEKSEYGKGDIVQFNGGAHYVSSTAASPASTGLSAGPAKIAYTNPGSAHPYCLITEDWGQTHVYGWVDAGAFS